MTLALSQCFVLVHDPDPALAFYRDTLGLELRNDVAKGDFRWITVGAGSQPGASGAEIVQEPTDQPWGTRDCAVRDPSGNMVRIDQPPADQG
ncbi:MAG TPA: VOC family protein [Solirubrobacterales bacterium]|jgi:catechol 2,3-dioxygenase-like lactoylglutathione lyase family enzyme